MFITRKKFEAELNKAREEGYCKAMEQRHMDEQFRYFNDRIERLENMINKPNPVGFETGERKC